MNRGIYEYLSLIEDWGRDEGDYFKKWEKTWDYIYFASKNFIQEEHIEEILCPAYS